MHPRVLERAERLRGRFGKPIARAVRQRQHAVEHRGVTSDGRDLQRDDLDFLDARIEGQHHRFRAAFPGVAQRLGPHRPGDRGIGDQLSQHARILRERRRTQPDRRIGIAQTRGRRRARCRRVAVRLEQQLEIPHAHAGLRIAGGISGHRGGDLVRVHGGERGRDRGHQPGDFVQERRAVEVAVVL